MIVDDDEDPAATPELLAPDDDEECFSDERLVEWRFDAGFLVLSLVNFLLRLERTLSIVLFIDVKQFIFVWHVSSNSFYKKEKKR